VPARRVSAVLVGAVAVQISPPYVVTEDAIATLAWVLGEALDAV